jgi:hypothetical protein
MRLWHEFAQRSEVTIEIDNLKTFILIETIHLREDFFEQEKE